MFFKEYKGNPLKVRMHGWNVVLYVSSWSSDDVTTIPKVCQEDKLHPNVNKAFSALMAKRPILLSSEVSVNQPLQRILEKSSLEHR